MPVSAIFRFTQWFKDNRHDFDGAVYSVYGKQMLRYRRNKVHITTYDKQRVGSQNDSSALTIHLGEDLVQSWISFKVSH